ncbi:hypothetical protein Tco_0653247 [Tanacetum coccineum]|uniref:Uncharacterized protein n=1 Tax=Tanacetum coccineum TaxID=301880 RepID=A0ABQ4X0A0_9ASTR
MPTEMELTLEQTQQGVSYEVSVLSDIEDSHGPSDAMHNPKHPSPVSKFNTTAGNPVKKILLKLNLFDHRLCKMVVEKCQSVKLKNFKNCNIKALKNGMSMWVPDVASPQDGKVIMMAVVIVLRLIDLKRLQDHYFNKVQGTKSIQRSQ